MENDGRLPRTTSDVYSEPETWKLLGMEPPPGLSDHVRSMNVLRSMTDDEFLDHLDDEAFERAADRIEALSVGYTDWRGFPLAGFESPRYLSEREREYKSWYRGPSEGAARSRRIREGNA